MQEARSRTEEAEKEAVRMEQLVAEIGDQREREVIAEGLRRQRELCEAERKVRSSVSEPENSKSFPLSYSLLPFLFFLRRLFLAMLMAISFARKLRRRYYPGNRRGKEKKGGGGRLY